MKKKIFRCVSELKILNDGTLFYEQEITFAWYLRFGLLTFFMKKKDRNLTNIKDIEKVEAKSSWWSGNVVTIYSTQKKIFLEATNKEKLMSIIKFIEGSQLKEKFIKK